MALKITNYSNLMQRRIKKILLICSSYDSFSLEEDGRLESQITKEYLELNISDPPKFIYASTAADGLDILDSTSDIDLIITMLNIGDMDPFSFAKEVKSKDIDAPPIILLSHFSREVTLRLNSEDLSCVDYVFCWLGNADLIFAIIKLIEDSMNSDADINGVGVQSILLVEDSIRFYSTYLPLIYKLVLHQSSEFLQEALNEQQQRLRRRARPKILLARTYDEAMELYGKFSNNILGVISDVTFKMKATDDDEVDAGIFFTKHILQDNPLIPIVLQSSRKNMIETAQKLGVGFICKFSKTLLMELSSFIRKELYFGKLVFTDPSTGEVLARVGSLAQLQAQIRDIDLTSLLHHTSLNHISKWLFARGLFSLAEELRKTNYEQFDSIDNFRKTIIQIIREYRSLLGQGVIAQFSPDTYNNYIWFARMGTGSLGGKARGLAFVNKLLVQNLLYQKYEGVKITIPRTVVIATDYFDEFITENGLQYVINSDYDDNDILSEFVGARLPATLVEELRAYIRTVQYPIAVRSSSKMEDSHFQPFAGIYSTYMVPRTDNEDQMLRVLGKAIKGVYASVFFNASKSYFLATSNVIAEEKMAVVLQEICGTEDQGLFFPTISGVARSINYYPIDNEVPEDGVANIALGLGKMVVEGGQTLRFSPRHPKKILQLSTTAMALSETQRQMYALNLSVDRFRTSTDDTINFDKIDVANASQFRNMRYVSSTWDRDNDRISDSYFTKGRKLITFSNILKYDLFPLAKILTALLDLGKDEMKTHVELEFAVNMDVPKGKPIKFNLLQIRPVAEEIQGEKLDWESVDIEDSIIYAKSALGLGAIQDISDIIYIKEELFKPALTKEIAEELESYNRLMTEQNINYVLIGPGRWGSSDSWLGIPVKWSHISQARVIVESGLKDFRVDPSQGTHFFQNLTSLRAGYMTLNPHIGDGTYNIDMLNSQDALYEGKYFRHVHFEKPLYIFIDGKSSKGIIKI